MAEYKIPQHFTCAVPKLQAMQHDLHLSLAPVPHTSHPASQSCLVLRLCRLSLVSRVALAVVAGERVDTLVAALMQLSLGTLVDVTVQRLIGTVLTVINLVAGRAVSQSQSESGEPVRVRGAVSQSESGERSASQSVRRVSSRECRCPLGGGQSR